MPQRTKPATALVDLGEMKAMLEWEARRDKDKLPTITPDLMVRWLGTNSASVRNIQERIYAWKQAGGTPLSYIDADGIERKV